MQVIFLGTGPTKGIKAKGKSKRFESSVLIKSEGKNILIDVTRDFAKQGKSIDRLDAVLITHAHRDAIGGIKKLDKWLKKKVCVYSLKETLKKIKNVKNLNLVAIRPFQPFNPLRHSERGEGIPKRLPRDRRSLAMTVIPVPVRHSIQKGFPTLGYVFNNKMAYISDTGGWDKKAEALMKKAEVLILDGAMWGKKLVSHLDIKEILPKICSWPNKKIIFTQIGHTAPRHKILEKEIRKICAKALPAYDGMRLRI